ncbi:MAG: ATP-binding protein [Reichenbachiella sp.]
MENRYLLLTLWLFSFQLAIADDRVQFTTINQSNGLVSGDVMCFEQDHNGVMWIGTKFGLDMYDGSSFDIYQLPDLVPYISDISSLCSMDSIKMYVGTLGDGLYIFDFRTSSFTRVDLSFGSDTIQNIRHLTSWNNRVWAATDQGLFSIDRSGRVRNHPFSQKPPRVITLFAHGQTLIVGTKSNGIYILDKEGGIDYLGLEQMQINTIAAVEDSVLIIGTQFSGLLTFDLDLLMIVNQNDILFEGESPIVNKVLQDSQNRWWVATDGTGLFELTWGNRLDIVRHFENDNRKKNTLVSNAVFSLYEDGQGNIWIGSIWKGLCVLNNSPAQSEFYYSDFYGENAYPVLSVYADQNELWFGTDGNGLSIYNKKTGALSEINSENTIDFQADYVQKICKLSNGNYILGGFSSGVTVLDKNKRVIANYSPEDTQNTISNNNVREIIEDESGNVWVATWGGGIQLFNPIAKTFQNFSFEENEELNSLTDDVTDISLDETGKGVWVATYGAGVFYFDILEQKYKRVNLGYKGQLNVLSLYLLNDVLWVGTWANGLLSYDIKSKKVLSNNDALLTLKNSRVTSIESDGQDKLWISSKKGIYSYTISSGSLSVHGGFDLITNNEFHINSSFHDPSGEIYFGGIEGVLKVYPEVTVEGKLTDKPALTGIYVHGEKLAKHEVTGNNVWQESTLFLPHDFNNLSFTFSSPQYPLSSNQYYVKLGPTQKEWVKMSSQQVDYPNLLPGDYLLQIVAVNPNGVWSEPMELGFQIDPPYWKTWYAYTFYVLVFVLMLYWFQKYSRDWESMKSNLRLETVTREKEQELHDLKQRFFTNISHEIRTPVTLILNASNRLEKSGLGKEMVNAIEVVRNSSNHLLNLVNELLDFRRLETDGIQIKAAQGDFVKFAKEIYLSFQTQGDQQNLDYRFLSHGDEVDMWYDRDQMEKVLYNLINNAFKYTPSGGVITVEVDKDDQFGYLKVIDSGKGIEDEQLEEIFKRFYQSSNASQIKKAGFGLGLSIAKDIVHLHSGEINASNNEDGGVCISVKLPIGRSHFTSSEMIEGFEGSDHLEHYQSETSPESIINFEEFGELSILLVEDNEHLRGFLKDLFFGILTVYEAENGAVGLSIAKDKIPDIIISDVMMPVMDGVAMTKQIKSNVLTSHIPVILLTARTNLIYKKEGFDVGADEYVTKPFNETLLKSRVQNILKGRLKLRERLLKDYITKPKEELNIATPDQQFLADFTSIIESKLDEDEFSAEFLARELGMSHSVVYKKIKALTGLTIVEFIRDFKLKRAALLLTKYQMTVTEVCYKIGFSDRRYFSRLFKAKFEMTPSDYIKKHKGE